MRLVSTQAEGSSLLQPLTNPRSVALIGASSDASRVTARPVKFLQKHGFQGKVFPVNRSSDRVHGLQAYPSLADIPDAVDHAYILLDRDLAMTAFQECVAKNVPVVTLLADGFADAGSKGRDLQEHLRRAADDAGILLIGPNSMGVADARHGFICTTNAAFGAQKLLCGRVAVLSQSGSLMGALVSRGAPLGIGFSTVVSMGNEAQSDVARLGTLLLQDPDTHAIVLVLETIRDRERLSEFARTADSMGKPVVVYTVARTEAGSELSVSHTGALIGAPAALDAFLRDCGFYQVDVFESAVEAPGAILNVRTKLQDRPRAVTVLSTTGGGGAMVVDQLCMRSAPVKACSSASREKLATHGIAAADGPLIDVTLAGTRSDVMKAVVSDLITDRETGILIVAVGSSAQFNADLAVTPVIDAVAEAGADAAPVLAFALPEAPDAVRSFNSGGVPAFRTVESLAATIRSVFETPDMGPGYTVSLPGKAVHLIDRLSPGLATEVQAYEVFEALGLRSCLRLQLEHGECVPEKLPFEFPVVVKLISPDLAHKTEAGAVTLHVPDGQALSHAIEEMTARVRRTAPDVNIDSVLIQPMCSGLAEVLVGLKRDPVAGPVLTVGMGGVAAEIYGDISLRPAPVSDQTVMEMLGEIKGMAILRGYRGAVSGDFHALSRAVAAFSGLAEDPRVEEAEINPLIVHEDGEGVTMLDALVKRSE